MHRGEICPHGNLESDHPAVYMDILDGYLSVVSVVCCQVEVSATS